MLLAVSVAACVAYIQASLVELYSFGLPAHFACAHHLLGLDIYLGHISLLEGLVSTLVCIRGDVQILSIGTHAAVVGHVLCGSASYAIGTDILNDV